MTSVQIGTPYDTNAPTTVCSTLLAEAFAQINFPILPLIKTCDATGQSRLFQRNPKFVFPSAFDKSPYFEVIKTAYVDQSPVRGDYHLLPWHGRIALDEPEADYYVDKKDPTLCIRADPSGWHERNPVGNAP